MSLLSQRRRATTAQVALLYPGIAPPSPFAGAACIGVGVLGSGVYRFDPFREYASGGAGNPNMIVFGDPGAGKSASVKTMVHRWVGLRRPNDPRRWVAICDPKGEYLGLARALSLEVLSLRPGGTVRLNPLEVAPDVAGSQAVLLRVGLLASMLSCLLHRDLDPLEDAAVGWVVDEFDRSSRATPTLQDVAALFARPTPEMASRAGSTPEQLADAIKDLRFGLGKILDRGLRGMFDGPSTVRHDPDGAGVLIDLSAVHGDRTVLGVVMAAATAWISGHLARRDGCQRVQVIDEAWALLANQASVRHLQASWKLCRDYGVANIAVAHRVADLRAQADDGTAMAKIAAGLLGDTETRILFRQAPDQVAETKALLGLSDTEAALLPRLARGRALWKRPGGSTLVQHVVAASEWPFCDTDANLLGRRTNFCDDFTRSAKFGRELAS